MIPRDIDDEIAEPGHVRRAREIGAYRAPPAGSLRLRRIPTRAAGQHSCGGICTGNTPQTGCFTSTTCAACTPPQNGTSICSIDGECDFTCPAGYQPNGNTCACAPGLLPKGER